MKCIQNISLSPNNINLNNNANSLLPLDSIETSITKIFTHVLMECSEGERLTEINRQFLAQDHSFDPMLLFQFINSLNTNCISFSEFLTFCEQHLNLHDNPLIKALFNLYDIQGYGQLSFDTFVTPLYPKNNSVLKRSVQERISNSKNKRLSQTTLVLIKKVYEREMNFVRNLLKGINTLKQCNYFIYDERKLFNTLITASMHMQTQKVDMKYKRGLNENDIYYLLQYAQIPFYTQDDVNAIFRRMDIDGDEVVTYEDFVKFVSLDQFKGYSYFSNTNSNNYNNNYYSGLNIRHASFEHPKCETQAQSQVQEDKKDNNNNNNPLTMNKNIIDDFKQLIHLYFNTLMNGEDVIEKSKINLTLCSSYNINDIFFYIKQHHLTSISDDTSQITKTDLMNFFSKYRTDCQDSKVSLMEVTIHDIDLIMKRGDLVHKGYLDKSDFFDLLTPFEKEYRNIIEQRIHDRYYSPSPKGLSGNCLVYLMKLFSDIIDYERQLNNIRHMLTKYHVEFVNLFYEISGGVSNSYFTFDNLENYFKKMNIMSHYAKHFKLLFIKLDRNRTGKIELFELSDELTPVL